MSTPVRYASRYGTAKPPGAAGCLLCGSPLPAARARYCSPACKQRAYRLRHVDLTAGDRAARTAELRRRRLLVPQTLYECPTCGERYLGEQRCSDCQRFCRRVGLGGACPHCDQPILVAELLGEEEVP